jgi:hypothetical protein
MPTPPKELHFRACINILTMPQGNSMPMATANLMATTAADVSTKASVVDAHSLPNLSLDLAIPQISQTLPIALSKEEIALRRQIATRIQITMGKDIMHFEKDIDPITGTVDIDWKFRPILQTGQDIKIPSHAVLRIYAKHIHSVEEDPICVSRLNASVAKKKAGKPAAAVSSSKDAVFHYLLGCEAIHMPSLMQLVLDVNTGKIDTEKQREYDFAAQTNFCSTFNLCTVVPFEKPLSTAEIQQMRNQLDIYKGGIAAYEMEVAAAKKEGREPVLTGHAYMPSPLRHLPDLETLVRLQQGLQQVYFSNMLQSSDIMIQV